MRWILLPAFDGTGLMFAPFVRELGGGFDTVPIAYPEEGPQDYETLADHVLESLAGDDEGTRYAVLGESFAGPLAYEVALRLGPRCRTAVFVATYLTNPSPKVLKVLGALPAPLVSFFVSRAAVVRETALSPEADPSVARDIARNFSSVAPAAIRSRLRTIGSLGALPGRRLDVPCLYIQASEDKLVPSDRLADYEACCWTLEAHRAQGGHFILQEAPRDCADIVCEWARG